MRRGADIHSWGVDAESEQIDACRVRIDQEASHACNSHPRRAVGGCSQALVTGSNKDPRAPVALTDSQVGHVQTVVARTLKDPDSAKFDSIAAGRAPDGRVFVCGWVNAKNSFGGYVGRQPFSGQLTDGAFALSYVGSDYMLRAFIQDQCGGLGEYYWNT